MFYSEGTMIAIGCLLKIVLVLASMPVLMWILLYRIINCKSNEWLVEWVFD
jgi:hypothetical protein